jgi:hypothetical protein
MLVVLTVLPLSVILIFLRGVNALLVVPEKPSLMKAEGSMLTFFVLTMTSVPMKLFVVMVRITTGPENRLMLPFVVSGKTVDGRLKKFVNSELFGITMKFVVKKVSVLILKLAKLVPRGAVGLGAGLLTLAVLL